MEKQITVGDVIGLFDEGTNIRFMENNKALCVMDANSKAMELFKDRAIEKISFSVIRECVCFHLISQEV